MATVSPRQLPLSSSSAGNCPPGFRSVYGGRRFSAFIRSTGLDGIVMPFSARNIRIARGLGPKESYNCMAISPRNFPSIRFGRATIQYRGCEHNTRAYACCAHASWSDRKLRMRFCPQCGAALIADAKFCVECGTALGGPGTKMPSAEPAVNQTLRNLPITTAFVGVFLAILVLGLLAAGWVMLRKPETVETASRSAPEVASGSGANSTSGTAGSAAPGQLPPGHPRIQLPSEAR